MILRQKLKNSKELEIIFNTTDIGFLKFWIIENYWQIQLNFQKDLLKHYRRCENSDLASPRLIPYFLKIKKEDF